MDLVCNKCDHRYDGAINRKGKDKKWFSTCPECGEQWEVEVPTGNIVMAFTGPVDDQEKPYRYMTEKFTGKHITAYYATETRAVFMDLWEEVSKMPPDMWYWVLDNGSCVCCGACDPGDRNILLEGWRRIIVDPTWYIANDDKERAMLAIQKGAKSYEYNISASIHASFSADSITIRREQSSRMKRDPDALWPSTTLSTKAKTVRNWQNMTAFEINVALAEKKWEPEAKAE